ncbi:hypothetical protein JDV09_04385 [Mycobacterium sp. Y57]|uniref:hypothetical protein n=1 Tax=Mycolicibacterium xanthum TaxID=2796469 RepID=UPI001C86431C|nr:hypothetical protein [Mycolicibacterium xanthum]MBX7431352.1 hypothetical protein [Mycolicibacterium xanthum]
MVIETALAAGGGAGAVDPGPPVGLSASVQRLPEVGSSAAPQQLDAVGPDLHIAFYLVSLLLQPLLWIVAVAPDDLKPLFGGVLLFVIAPVAAVLTTWVDLAINTFLGALGFGPPAAALDAGSEALVPSEVESHDEPSLRVDVPTGAPGDSPALTDAVPPAAEVTEIIDATAVSTEADDDIAADSMAMAEPAELVTVVDPLAEEAAPAAIDEVAVPEDQGDAVEAPEGVADTDVPEEDATDPAADSDVDPTDVKKPAVDSDTDEAPPTGGPAPAADNGAGVDRAGVDKAGADEG